MSGPGKLPVPRASGLRPQPPGTGGRLALGTATLGNLGTAMSDDEAERILQSARRLGVRDFDSAPHYGLGLAEQRLGRALAGVPREEFRVSTKVGRLLVDGGGPAVGDHGGFAVQSPLQRVWDFSESGIRRSLEGSLERLGLDRLDGVFLHDPDLSHDPLAVPTGLAALARLREEGVVTRIGVATKDRTSLEIAVASGLADLLMIPGRLTLLNEEAGELAVRCRERGIGIANAAPFNGGGLLSNAVGEGYGRLDRREQRRRSIALEVCERHGVALPSLALQYAARREAVETVVIGVRHPDQLIESIAGISEPLSEEFWQELSTRLGAPFEETP